MVLMGNAKYHTRFIEKASTINMKKDEIIAFMSKHDIEILKSILAKSVLLEKILNKILKNSMAEKAGYSVLRLSPYPCILNSIETTRASLECL